MRSLAVFHIPSAAGPPQHVRPWIEHLAERGDVAVLAPDSGSALELYDEIASTRTFPYDTLTFPSDPLALARLGARLVFDTARLARHIRTFDADLVLVTTTYVPAAVAAARLAGVRCVVYVAELFDVRYARTPGRAPASSALLGFTQRASSALVCCSNAVASQFARNGGAPVETIYPGVTVAERAVAKPGADDRDDFPRLGVIGNVTHGRGQDIAIRAFARVRDMYPRARLTIVGPTLPRTADIRYEQSLRSLVAELGVEDAVAFAGFVPSIADVYDEVDIVVNPIRLTESLGRVAIEALAAATPVVSSRVGAIPEVLTDGHDALLVEPGDVDALAAAIARLAGDDALRRRLTSNGRETIRTRFDERAGTDAFARLVSRVVAADSRT